MKPDDATPASFDPRVDDYIARAPGFARPILRHLREIVHAGCPEVAETIKWQRAFFTCQGQFLCNMAAFKAHCAFGFWDEKVRADITRDRQAQGADDQAAGQFGRITRLEDLPDAATLGRYLAEAVRRVEPGKSAWPRPRGGGRKPMPPTPDDLAQRLRANGRAGTAFEKFAPSCRREYIEWITAAKSEGTRRQRLDTAMEWIAEGKMRHWKYQGKAALAPVRKPPRR